jgi:hypothetical protein
MHLSILKPIFIKLILITHKKQRRARFFVHMAVLGFCLSLQAQPSSTLPLRQGNPVFEGWYADPEAVVFGQTYWIYPTFSGETLALEAQDSLTPWQREAQKNSINPQYVLQTFFDAFSSADLVHWTKHSKVLSIAQVKWAAFALWAPSVVAANGKYYLYFGANDIQTDQEVGGIGVAVADKPEGPFTDALGKPLIGNFYNKAQPIDQYVFTDDDGTHYLYYGGWRHCNVAKLGEDLVSLVPFDDGQLMKELTPEGYVEGPFMLKRKGVYYLMWSEGGWTGPDYCVAYAMANSPLGPFKRMGKILQQDAEVATGAGHHSVIQDTQTGQHYIVYHRHPLGAKSGNHRVVCIDRMNFNADGTIAPVKISFEGVAAKP